MPPEWAGELLWAVTLAWVVIFLATTAYAAIEYRAGRAQHREFRDVEGVSSLTAYAKKFSFWMLFISSVACLIGVQALLALIFFPDPRPDTSFYTAILRGEFIALAVGIFFAVRRRRQMRRAGVVATALAREPWDDPKEK